MSRQLKTILKDLCGYNLSMISPMDRLPPDYCYAILIGQLPSPEYMTRWLAQKSSIKDDGKNARCKCSILGSSELESILEHIKLVKNTDQLENYRKSHLVFEDNFNASLNKILERKLSYQQLQKVCYKYEVQDEDDAQDVLQDYEERVEQSYGYFLQHGLSIDEAKSLALALCFYTGSNSETCNRGASMISRVDNGKLLEKDIEYEVNEAAIIVYYMVKALSYIPFHWGYVTRACELTDEDLQIYIPGSLITWIQFSSAKKGEVAAVSKKFRTRNTLFKIFSLTGRAIKQFSEFPEEDEVLFPPHSTFLVCHREIDSNEGKHIIYMRQVELGLCKCSILWVDDNIFDAQWENKKHMEDAAVKMLNKNVHFIPKSSTDCALAFLRSPFGQRLKNQQKFRIVTDMHRSGETPEYNAGVRLIKALRQMGFNHECLVFVNDRKEARKIVESTLDSNEQKCVTVSNAIEDLQHFVNFKDIYSSTKESKPRISIRVPKPSENIEEPVEKRAPIVVDTRMMHSWKNTNVEVIINNARKRDLFNSPNNCILFTTGAFNPVTPINIRNLLRVKDFLEQGSQRWNVLAAYMSPAHDKYVRSKLERADWINADDRCQLCERAIKYEGTHVSSWITVSRGECQWKDGFVNFDKVTSYLEGFLNSTPFAPKNPFEYPLRIVYVCGLAQYRRCSRVADIPKKKNLYCAVTYERESDINYVHDHSSDTLGIMFVPFEKEDQDVAKITPQDICKHFKQKPSSNDNIGQAIYPHIRDYLNKKYRSM